MNPSGPEASTMRVSVCCAYWKVHSHTILILSVHKLFVNTSTGYLLEFLTLLGYTGYIVNDYQQIYLKKYCQSHNVNNSYNNKLCQLPYCKHIGWYRVYSGTLNIDWYRVYRETVNIGWYRVYGENSKHRLV